MRRLAWCAAVVAAVSSPTVAQQLLDRVLARVGNEAITLTEVRAARELGVIDVPPGADDEVALERMIERELVLAELLRFPQPEPDARDVDEELARMTARAGDRLDEIKTANGFDDRRLRDLARDTVRIRAYLDQRFPPVPAGTADAQQYYRDHPDEFRREDGSLMPFDEAEPEARRAAALQAREDRIARWLQNLRGRVPVSRPETR